MSLRNTIFKSLFLKLACFANWVPRGDPITCTLKKQTRKVGKKREKPIGFQIMVVAVLELPWKEIIVLLMESLSDIIVSTETNFLQLDNFLLLQNTGFHFSTMVPFTKLANTIWRPNTISNWRKIYVPTLNYVQFCSGYSRLVCNLMGVELSNCLERGILLIITMVSRAIKNFLCMQTAFKWVHSVSPTSPIWYPEIDLFFQLDNFTSCT